MTLVGQRMSSEFVSIARLFIPVNSRELRPSTLFNSDIKWP
jgi:hypothetical protein